MAEPWRTLLTLAAGFGTGVLSAMFGVGGAVVSTPAIRAIGATAFEAVGTTLPSILPSAITGTLRYRREGLIRGRVVAWVGGVGVTASVGGSLLSHAVPGNGHLLMVATAVLMFTTASRMARTPAPAEPVDPAAAAPGATHIPHGTPWWHLALIGVVAGGLSGLLGVGGGIVMVPAFTEMLALPIKEAVGTSLAAVGLLAVPGIITHSALGDINWAYAVPLSLAVVPGARIGAHIAVRATDRGLRLSVAVALGITAVIYATGELLALR